MTRVKQILLVVGLVGVAVGGFALTKFLTRNVKRVKGGVIVRQNFEQPSEPFEIDM
jgi:hypothetical protein